MFNIIQKLEQKKSDIVMLSGIQTSIMCVCVCGTPGLVVTLFHPLYIFQGRFIVESQLLCKSWLLVIMGHVVHNET